MGNSKNQNFQIDWNRFFIPDSKLPEKIFQNQFDKYLFFDIDIRSSGDLISILQATAVANLVSNFQVNIFSFTDRLYQGCLNSTTDWALEIQATNKKMKNRGDYEGLILADENGKWIAYQSSPVDIGILAFTSLTELPERVLPLGQFFFSCSDISNWVASESPRNKNLVINFGRDYLVLLIQNYCKK